MREVEGRVGTPFTPVDVQKPLSSISSASGTLFVETSEKVNGQTSAEKPLPKMTVNRATGEIAIDGEVSRVIRGPIVWAVALHLADHPGEWIPSEVLSGVAIGAGSTQDYVSVGGDQVWYLKRLFEDKQKEQKILLSKRIPNSNRVAYRLNAEVTIVDEPARNLSRVVEEQINFDPSPLAELDPQEVARRASQHDPNAFGQLYNDNLNAIYRFVFYRVGNAQLAEDLVEDVFANAWENIDQFQWRELPLQHWLLRIARNVVVDHWRANHRFTASLEGTRILDGTQDPQEIAVSNWELATVRQALAHLSDDQRDVLIYRFIEGFSHEDVAKALGKSVVAIRQTQLRALRALRKVMGSLYEGSKGEGRLVNGR